MIGKMQPNYLLTYLYFVYLQRKREKKEGTLPPRFVLI